MSEPKISVIIPVYNAQNYLVECIESVLKQSFQDLEIICIDDGSGDNSGLILKEFSKKDKRVSIITQNNKGVSIARNEGIKRAKGKYIYFLDSDDYIEENALDISYRTMEEKALDAVYFDTVAFGEADFSKEFIEEKNRYYARKHDYSAIYTGEELLCKLLENHEYTCPIWKQLIRRDLLIDNDISFYDGIIHQDELYTIQTMMLAQRVLYIDRTLHHRRLRKNSIMTKPLEYHSVYSYFFGIKEAYRFLLKKDCNQQNLGLILSHLKRLAVLARSQYSKLPENEQKKYLDFKEEDKFLFELCIADGVGTVKQRDILSEERKNLFKEREDRKKQLSDLQVKAALLEQKNAEARKQLQASEDTLAKERETGKQQLADLEEKITLLEQKDAEARKQLQASEETLAKERETGKQQLADLEEKITLLEQKDAEARKQLQASEGALARERETGKQQLADLKEKTVQIERLQEKYTHAEQLEAEVLNRLNDKELLLAKEREISQKQIKGLEAEFLKQLNDKELLLAKEREISQKQIKGLEAEFLKQLNDKELLLAKEREISQKQIKGLEEDIVSLRRENEKTRTVLECVKVETEKKLNETKKNLSEVREANCKLKEQQLNQLKKLQQKIEQVKRENGEKEKDIRRLSRHLNDVKTGWSFRIGRIFTFVPRKVRDFLRN